MNDIEPYAILTPSDRTFGCCFDREGRPISFETHATLRTLQYSFVRRTQFPDLVVSTVWTGMNTEAFGPPEIFETMLRCRNGGDALHGRCWRYSTLDQAQKAHAALVAGLEKGTGVKGLELVPAEGQEVWITVWPESRRHEISIVPARKMDASGMWQAVCSCGEYSSRPYGAAEAAGRAGDEHAAAKSSRESF